MKTLLNITSLLLLISYSSYGQNEFEESAIERGLIFEFQESLKMGGGAASFDYDNDGDDDIYVVGGQNPDGLFENDGEGNFTNVSLVSNIGNLTSSIMTTSVVTGDIDNDGYREIFVGTIGEAIQGFNSITRNFLLKYDPQTSSYSDITQSSLLTDESFAMGGHFLDVNQDGFLDLYIMNYVENPKLIQDQGQVVGFDHDCYENKLFINQGDGTFIDRTQEYGLNHEACTLAATSSDLDWDGDPDLIVANDFGRWIVPNQMYLNNGQGQPFSEIGSESNANAQMYGMGIGIGDYDEDLDLDFYVTNIGENYFFENNGDMTFTNVAPQLNIQNEFTSNELHTTGWGAIMEDFNNDSYLDIFVSNGYVYSAVDIDDVEQYDELFLGNASFEFTRATPDCGIDFLGTSRGAMFGDWNNDGSLDIVTITNENLGQEPFNSINFYQNNINQGNWIGFKLKGTVSTYDAYGAKAVVFAEGRTLLRELRGGDSHASQNSSRLHFGLGTINEVDSVKIYWPSGIVETFELPTLNTYTEVIEGVSTSTFENEGISTYTVYPNPASDYITLESVEEPKFPIYLSLINSMGQTMMHTQLRTKIKRIDISNYNSGVYTLVVKSQNRITSNQLIIINP